MCMCVYVHECVDVYACLWVCVCARTCVCVHVCVYTFSIVMCQDTCERLCFKLGMMLNTTIVYSLIPV